MYWLSKSELRRWRSLVIKPLEAAAQPTEKTVKISSNGQFFLLLDLFVKLKAESLDVCFVSVFYKLTPPRNYRLYNNYYYNSCEGA